MDALITYVDALFTVFTIVIFVRLLLSWFEAFGRGPAGRAGRAFFDFIHGSTDWFLNFFRRFIPPLGMFDLSPIVALLVLFIVRSLVITVLESF